MRVLLLDGNENQAVAAVRSLGRAGHQVMVGEKTRWSKAGWSRHAAGSFFYPSPRVDPDAFIARLVAECEKHPGTFVLPMTESSTSPVSAARDRLIGAGARLVPHRAMAGYLLPPRRFVTRLPKPPILLNYIS